MIPPRCFTCNQVIGHKFEEFLQRKDNSGRYGYLLNEMRIERICCRRMLLAHVEVVDEICNYSAVKSVLDESKTVFDAFVKDTRTISCD